MTRQGLGPGTYVLKVRRPGTSLKGLKIPSRQTRLEHRKRSDERFEIEPTRGLRIESWSRTRLTLDQKGRGSGSEGAPV